MIDLKHVAEKLQEILNAATGFEQYQFAVESTGFHLDHVFDKKTGKNFIPVFISTMGGQNNPVPYLKQSEYNVPITFYFPVRFKDDFISLYDFLTETFVGKFIDFGSNEGRTNISIPQFGELQQLDLKEFKNWVDELYKQPIEIMEMWMSMTVNLFISQSGSEFIYGDKIKISNVVIDYQNTRIFEDSNVISIERADIGTSENAPQQILDETYIKGYPANLGYTKTLPLIIKNNDSYRALLEVCEVTKDVQNLKVIITEVFPFETPLTATNSYYVSNYSRRTAFGSLIGITLTLTDLREI